jgi:hypothetical protein
MGNEYEYNDNNNNQLVECPICFEIIDNNYTTNCCKQLIHKECLDKCNYTCPFCRQKVNGSNNTIINIPEYYQNNTQYEIEVRISRYIRWRKYLFILFCCFLVGWVPGILVYQVEQNNKFIKKNNITINY